MIRDGSFGQHSNYVSNNRFNHKTVHTLSSLSSHMNPVDLFLSNLLHAVYVTSVNFRKASEVSLFDDVSERYVKSD